jgi:hypothetical protein
LLSLAKTATVTVKQYFCVDDQIREYVSASADTAKSCLRNLMRQKSTTGCSEYQIDKKTVKYACEETKDLGCKSGQGERFCNALEDLKELLAMDCNGPCGNRVEQINKSINNLEFWHRFIMDNDLGVKLDLAEQARQVNEYICRDQVFRVALSRKKASATLNDLSRRASTAQSYLANIQLLGDTDYIRECRGLNYYLERDVEAASKDATTH